MVSRLVLAFVASLFLAACQTTGETTETVSWEDPIQSARKITVAPGQPKVMSYRYRSIPAGWQENVKFSQGQIFVTALIERYFLISQLEQEKAEMIEQYKSLIANGFEIDKFEAGTQRSEPAFFGIIRSLSMSCVLFRKYTTHPGASQGYLQSEEHRTAKIDGFHCITNSSESNTALIGSAKQLMTRISFR